MGSKVDENGAERAPTPEREIINAKLDDLSEWISGQSHDASENGLARGWDSQTIGDPDPKPAAGGQADDLHDLTQTPRHARLGVNERRETFHKDLARTG